MSAVLVPITIEQGATFFMDFEWRLDDNGSPGALVTTTGMTLRMQIRKAQQQPVLVEALSTGANPMLSHDDAGTISIVIPASATNLLTSKNALYDMEAVETDGTVHRVIEGSVTVKPNITQITGDDPPVGA